MKKCFTCIVCPMGCDLEVELDGDKVINVSGNTCPRGKVYASDECTNPTRTITSTVKCENGDIVCVKTDRPIAKDKIFECMKVINNAKPHLPINIGDVIIKDVFGANVVATSNAK